MVAVQIRDVPEDVRDALVRLADRKGQSLQAFLLSELNSMARREREASLFAELTALGGGSHLTPAEAQQAVDVARAERDGRSGSDPARPAGGSAA